MTVEPCTGTIIVILNGKEVACKEISLNNGLNKINIELSK